MRYFKWGVARLILEADVCPDVLPMWIEGNETVMAEDREWPRFVPRVWRKETGIWIGENVGGVGGGVFASCRERWRRLVFKHKEGSGGNDRGKFEDVGRDIHVGGSENSELGVLTDPELMFGDEATALRKECTMLVRQEVLRVRRERGLADEDPKYGAVETWAVEGKGESEGGRKKDGSLVGET